MIDLGQIQSEILEWGDSNFPAPDDETYFRRACIGLIEEIGEIAHIVLKREQGIRPEDTTDEKLRDGIGDAGIYLLHAGGHGRGLKGVWKPHAISSLRGADDPLDAVGALAFSAARLYARRTALLYAPWNGADAVYLNLSAVASLYGWRAEECIAETWRNVVGKRDWQSHPNDGVSR